MNFAGLASEADTSVASRWHLCSDKLPAKYRLALWSMIVKEEFGLDVTPHKGAPLVADFGFLKIGAHSIGQLQTSPVRQIYAQSPEQGTAGAGPASLRLFLVRRGRMHVTLKDRSDSYGVGEVGSYRTDEERSIEFLDEDSDRFSVVLPVDSLETMAPGLDNLAGGPVRYDSAALQQLQHYASTLSGLQDEISPHLAKLATAHITQLVAMSLRGPRQEMPTGRHGIGTRRREAIKQVMLKQLGNPALSGEEVAKVIGVTPRYLQRLLRQDATTFTDLLRDIRLQRANLLLRDPDNARRDILSIALEVGFNDLSYFYRAFREKFGQPPARFRRTFAGGLTLTDAAPGKGDFH